jgi:hypothetical protein
MDLPSFESYASKNGNTLVFTLGEVDVYFSYKTPVAFRVNGKLTVRENAWGPTTGKHLKAIDGGDTEAKAARVDADTFQARLSAALEAADPVRRALAALLVWALDGNKTGNPYAKPEVTAALEALGATMDPVTFRHDIELSDLRDIAGIPQPD